MIEQTDLMHSGQNVMPREGHSIDVLGLSKYRHTSLYCTSMHCASQGSRVLKIEGETIHQHEDRDSLFVIPAFLTGMEPAIALRYACLYHKLGS